MKGIGISSGLNVPDYTYDEARLGALADFRILDTAAEEGFDSIVELATVICDCPVALVSLVDRDRQWFKARIGFPSCETDLSSSVCAHALVEPELLVIPDLTADPRTTANPLVTGEPHIRFYAGAPLRTADGQVVGSLCVIDSAPRPEGLTPVQRSSLKALGSQVMAQLDLRRSVQQQQRLLDQGDVLIRTQNAISAAQGDFELVLRALVAGAMELVPHAEGGVIEMREGEELVYRATAGTIAHETGLRLPITDSLAGSCFLSGKPLLCADVLRDGQIKPALIERLNIRSALMVPLSLGSKAVGVLKLQASAPDAFSHRDLKLARVFAGSVAGGLAETTFRRQARFQEMTLELGDRLRDAATTRDAILIGGEIAGRTLGAFRAGYCAVDPGTDMLTIPEHWGESSIAGTHSLRDFGSFIEQLKHGSPVAISDVATDPRTQGFVSNFQALGIASVINLPVLERGRMVSIFFVHRAERHAWTDEEIALCGNIADRTRAAVARLQAERRQAMLNEELAHRMKNTMAMVQAVAVQTLKDVTEKDAVTKFTERLHSLSTAHEVLLQTSWASARIRAVIDSVLGTFGRMDRFRIQGADLQLGPRAVVSMSMLLHELATNAFKYGALSSQEGTVRVEWRIEPATAGDELVLDWIEENGPPAVPPKRKGFGTRLIRLGLLGTGGVTLDYQGLGFRAEMRALLVLLQQS